MKRDFSDFGAVGFGGVEFRPRRDRALGELFTNFVKDRPLKHAAIDEMWESLSPEEQSASFDSALSMRVRLLLSQGKACQAYQTLVSGLRLHPTNLSLQLELGACLAACHEQLDQFLADDPQNPLVHILYEILLTEANLNQESQARYAATLIADGRLAEAARIVRPLIALYPAMVGLRDTVEALATRLADKELMAYATSPQLGSTRTLLNSVLTPFKASALKERFFDLQVLVNSDPDSGEIDKILRDAIGEWLETSAIDLAYKDFYYLKAICEGNRGRHWEAISILQCLVAADPCNLFYRRSLNIELSRFSNWVTKSARTGKLAIDIRDAYLVMREIGIVRYEFLKQVCLAEIDAGAAAGAKAKMTCLMAVNPHDGDYLFASLEVAVVAGDDTWLSELHAKAESLRSARPWDLKLASLVGRAHGPSLLHARDGE